MISCSALDSRGVRAFGWVLLLVTTTAGCDQPLNQGVLAEGQANARGTSQSLAFDLPDGFWNKDASGEFVITGFRLGFFALAGTEPLATRDIGREAIVVDGTSGRVLLTPQRVPPEAGPVVIRLQTVTRQGASEWSAPSAAIAEVSGPPARPATATAKSGRPRLSMSDVERHPLLAEAFRTAVPGAEAEGVLEPFRTVDELALALVVSDANDLALQKLSATMVGPPRRSLPNALRELKPALRGTNPLREARENAQRLLQKGPAPKP